MEFSKESHRVSSLRLKDEVVEELTAHLMLCYVGSAHHSTEIHQEQEQRSGENADKLKSLKELAFKIRDDISRGDLVMFGRYLNESWEHKRALASRISNGIINRLYETGLAHGAYGGKLLGAGNGGYLLFFYQPAKRNELVHALTAQGGEILPFQFDQTGMKIWEAQKF